MSYGMRLALGPALVVIVSGCAPSPLSDEYWMPQRPLGQEIEAYRPAAGEQAAAVSQQPPDRAEPLLPGAGELTLRGAMAAALLGNPELASFAYEVRAAEARAVQAGLWANPELELEVENFAGSGELSGADGAEVTLALSQTFPLGGDIAKRQQLAETRGKLAGWDYESARIALLAEVTQRYVAVLSAQRQVALAEESVTLAEQVAASIGRRVEAGDAAPVERTRAAVPVATARIELGRARRSLEAARARLALSWGGSSPRFTAAAGDLDRVEAIPTVTAVAQLISQNPDVARWAMEIAGRQAEVEMARAEATPDFTGSLGYRWFNDSDDSALVAGVSIPLPIFDRGQGDILASRIGVTAAQKQQRAAELRVKAALTSAYARLAGGYDEAVALRDAALPPATDAYEATRQAFDQGNLGYLDVLDAERTLIDLRRQYLDALAEYHSAVAEIEGLIGQPLSAVDHAQPPHPEHQAEDIKP